MKHLFSGIVLCTVSGNLAAAEFHHVGDFVLKSHYRITAEKITPIPTKTLVFKIFSDGTTIHVQAGDDKEAKSVFSIYRSDGISRQRPNRGALEVVPGLQALSQSDNVVRHLRLTRETLTITTFPGVSDQTVVSHFTAAPANPDSASEGKTNP